MSRKKVYAVRKGRTTGLFHTWDDCKAQVERYPGAEFKGFTELAEAMEYLRLSGAAEQDPGSGKAGRDPEQAAGSCSKTEKTASARGEAAGPATVRAYVDGSFDSVSFRYSCGVVILEAGEDGDRIIAEFNEAFDDPEAAKHRNVAGEVMGSTRAIEYCLAHDIDSIEIYHDYEGIGAWADRRWKANNPLTQGYRDFVAEARKSMDISFIKVRGHSGDKYNDMADELAGKALC